MCLCFANSVITQILLYETNKILSKDNTILRNKNFLQFFFMNSGNFIEIKTLAMFFDIYTIREIYGIYNITQYCEEYAVQFLLKCMQCNIAWNAIIKIV